MVGVSFNIRKKLTTKTGSVGRYAVFCNACFTGQYHVGNRVAAAEIYIYFPQTCRKYVFVRKYGKET